MIRVMVVDDSPLVRKIATDILSGDSQIEVTATAATAEFALKKLDREVPDVITMDIEMPGIGGVEAIRTIMARRPTPIIVLSSHVRRGADFTLQALEAGALDFVLKPSASLSGGLDHVAQELREKVRSAARTSPLRAGIDHGPVSRNRREGACRLSGGRRHTPIELVAIGTSTGGPVALRRVLEALPSDFPVPIVAVQHMPPVFTRAFAERLDSCAAISVKEASEGDLLLPARVLIAPGDSHVIVSRSASQPRLLLDRRGPVSGHRPSIDVLMHSVALDYGPNAVGVIMTGMGRDGADGIRALHRRGGTILAQDRESSVIFGMNREVIKNGDADAVVPLDRIAEILQEVILA